MFIIKSEFIELYLKCTSIQKFFEYIMDTQF